MARMARNVEGSRDGRNCEITAMLTFTLSRDTDQCVPHVQVRAIKKLKVLGNGHFEIFNIGKMQYVRSVPGELNMDSSKILEVAQVSVDLGEACLWMARVRVGRQESYWGNPEACPRSGRRIHARHQSASCLGGVDHVSGIKSAMVVACLSPSS